MGNVYFAICGDLVKIGYAADVALRLVQLQTGNPTPINILAVLTGVAPHVERMYHREFHDLRQLGEWFSYRGRLRVVIAHVQAGARPTTPQAVAYYAGLFHMEQIDKRPHADVRKTVKLAREYGYSETKLREHLLARGPEYLAAVASYERRHGALRDAEM